jgi:hypothetical protein
MKWSLTVEEPLELACAVEYPDDLHAIFEWTVEDQVVSKAGDRTRPETRKRRRSAAVGTAGARKTSEAAERCLGSSEKALGESDPRARGKQRDQPGRRQPVDF